MLYPIRFVVCTYNLWNDQRWPERQEPLRKFLEYHLPDILCVQELRPVTREFLDAVLDTHQRVDDPFEGWLREGNIYWNEGLFDLVEYGAEDIGIFEELRRLFWVRLRLRGANEGPQMQRTLFVATVHYTWYGNELEKTEGINPRLAQARETIQALNTLAPLPEPLLFMGDLNDFMHPLRILREGGLTDSFAALGCYSSPTWPATPTQRGTPEVDDWILHRGPIRPMISHVADFYVGDLAPSDHKPVMATYRIL
jgi:endonuclease/exonuclease/phosphatase family metal-dependent hydrolase